MGKLDVKMMRYLSKEDFRVLTAIEMGMKNHELVTAILAAQIANLHHGGLHKILKELCKHRLLMYESSKHYEGYRLTNTGYDYLALKTLTARDLIDSFGNQIGVGKESNIYVVSKKGNENAYCLKLHRLGRTCFRNVKNKRDYHQHRKHMSWLYLSRVSATKEFAYMKALHDRGFPVPKPIDFNRHCIIMELVDGVPLCNVREIEHKERLYDDLMNLICRLAFHGVIHGDFNEFNIMISPDEKPIIIDFPQMVSTEHEEAELYFERDVNCVREFFRRRFDYESSMYPVFKNVVKENAEDKRHSKVQLHSPTVSDVEDYELDDDNDEDFDNLQEKLSKLQVEKHVSSNVADYLKSCDQIIFEGEETVEDELTSPVDESLESSDTRNTCEKETSVKQETDSSQSTSAVDENSKSGNIQDSSEKQTPNVDDISSAQQDETNSCYDEHQTYDVRSTVSTIIPEYQVKRKMRMELLKRDKKVQNKRVLKKATKSTRNRRENVDIAKENIDFWGID